MNVEQLDELLLEYRDWRLRLARADAKLDTWRDEQDLNRADEILVRVLNYEYQQARSKCLELQAKFWVEN